MGESDRADVLVVMQKKRYRAVETPEPVLAANGDIPLGVSLSAPVRHGWNPDNH
jgi:hypothetical protein